MFVFKALHYLPFFLMERALFLHHYLPAFVFAAMLTALTTEHLLLSLLHRPQLWYGTMAVIVSTSAMSFWHFLPFAHFLPLSADEVEGRQWLGTWRFPDYIAQAENENTN